MSPEATQMTNTNTNQNETRNAEGCSANDALLANRRTDDQQSTCPETSAEDRHERKQGKEGKQNMPRETQVDFFISYNQTDRNWADGLAHWLTETHYATKLQSQDFVAGSNFVSEMNAALSCAKRVIAVISPDYFDASFPEAEWTAAFARDPTGSRRSLILVRVRECDIPPLLQPLVYIDLVGMSVGDARKHFLSETKAALANARAPKERRARKGNIVPFSIPNHPPIHQEIRGNGNVQSVNVFARPAVIKTVVERREGSLTSAECIQVKAWIEDLAEGTTGMSRQQAYRMWWARFKTALEVEKYEELASTRMFEAGEWYRMQRTMQTRGLKSTAPDVWRRKRIVAIKAAMGEMGVVKHDYYPDIAHRLRMKKPFASLNDLTKQDLDRVYTMALRDRDLR